MENIEKINYHETKFLDQNGRLQTVKIPVVQDLARLRTLPEKFIQNPVAAHPFNTSNALFEEIDVTRLRSKSDPTSRVVELRKLARICGEWGMFTIRNHGLDPRVLEEVEEVVKKFFELPFEEKRSSVGTYMDADNMGYGRNFMKSQDQPLDWIDRLTMRAAPVGATDGLRVWPNNPINFRGLKTSPLAELLPRMLPMPACSHVKHGSSSSITTESSDYWRLIVKFRVLHFEFHRKLVKCHSLEQQFSRFFTV